MAYKVNNYDETNYYILLSKLFRFREIAVRYIKCNEPPHEMAQKSYEGGYYIEAIQVLHTWLENQARSYLMLVGCVHFKAEQKDTWDLSDTLSLNDTLKVLRVLNQITGSEYSDFKRFNSLRNKIVHQYFKEPYEKEYLGVPMREYDEVFQGTLSQAYFFTQKCEQIVG